MGVDQSRVPKYLRFGTRLCSTHSFLECLGLPQIRKPFGFPNLSPDIYDAVEKSTSDHGQKLCTYSPKVNHNQTILGLDTFQSIRQFYLPSLQDLAQLFGSDSLLDFLFLSLHICLSRELLLSQGLIYQFCTHPFIQELKVAYIAFPPPTFYTTTTL